MLGTGKLKGGMGLGQRLAGHVELGKHYAATFFRRIRGKSDAPSEHSDDDEESLISTSTWSSGTTAAIKQRFILKKHSWGAQDDEDYSEKESSQYLIVLILRFLTGVALTQSFYMLLTYHSQWNPKAAAFYTGVIGFFVAIGMAFSEVVRSVIALVLPTLCTSKGRSIVLAFILLMVMTGPSANIAHNYRVMTRSLSCGDELSYNMTQGLKSMVHAGKNSILSSMDDTVDAVIEAVGEAEAAFLKFAESLQSVSDVIKGYNDFMRNMQKVCENQIGAFFCIIPAFVAKQAKKLITEPLADAVERMRKEFDFEMTFSHELRYDVNMSKSIHEISDDILNEVSERIGFATSVFDWLKLAMTFSTALVVLKAMRYRYKYLSSNEFDNNYITEQFLKLDKRRKKQGYISVLPLKSKEIPLYVRPTRIWMSRQELKKFAKGFSFLTFNFVYAVIILLVDYGFWRLLMALTMSLSLRKQSGRVVNELIKSGATSVGKAVGLGDKAETVAELLSTLTVGGRGFVALIYRAIASGLERIASKEGYEFGIDKCLPEPKTPDFAQNTLILILFAVLYIVCLFEPYLLRIRRRIMASFHPKREKVRILFLRSKILSLRGIGPNGNLSASALRRAFFDAQRTKEEEKRDFFAKRASQGGIIGCISRILSRRNVYRCYVCRLAGGKEHAELFTKCKTFGCKGVYCIECYEELHRMCMICLARESNWVKRDRKNSLPGDSSVAHSAEADLFVDSSGISDSSASSSGEEDSDYDITTPSGEHKAVHFDDYKNETRYLSLAGSEYDNISKLN